MLIKGNEYSFPFLFAALIANTTVNVCLNKYVIDSAILYNLDHFTTMNFMRKLLLCLVASLGLAVSSLAFAEIYKHVDENGRVTYSNTKSKGATRLEIDPEVNNVQSQRPAQTNTRSATPNDFPRVDKQTQNGRDNKRKEILQSELEAEKEALEEAKRAYAEGESKPEVYQRRNANGTTSTFRNVPKFEEKMRGLQAEVDAHTRNIELLQQELSRL